MSILYGFRLTDYYILLNENFFLFLILQSISELYSVPPKKEVITFKIFSSSIDKDPAQ